MDGTGILFHREGSDPDGNQEVLAVRQAEPRMSRDFKREAAVTPSVNELPAGRPAQGNGDYVFQDIVAIRSRSICRSRGCERNSGTTSTGRDVSVVWVQWNLGNA